MERHRPPHIYRDDATYFITSSTIDKVRYFDTEEKKDILSDVIHKACERFTMDLIAWTVLDDHYHILVEIDRGRDISKLINNIHANSSRLLRALSGATPCRRALSGATPEAHGVAGESLRKIWHQYFDRCIRSERDYWMRFNYIHHNCIKHKYTKSMEEYKYSSYRKWVNEKGIEWIKDVLSSYPVLDFSADGEVD